MKKERLDDIQKRANGIDSDTDMSLFISSFSNREDKLVVAIICAWLSNGYANEYYMAQHIIHDIMDGKPSEYIKHYSCYDNIESRNNKNSSFFYFLTFKNFDNLCLSLKNILTKGGVDYLQSQLNAKRRKRTYAHSIVADIVGEGVGFPTRKSNCTFFRVNLFLYWATYKVRFVECNLNNFLLPCNDKVFENAYKYGIISKAMKHNLNNSIKITNIAKKCFGDDSFYKMYELLSEHYE